MVAIVSGNSLGLSLTSMATLGQRGAPGAAQQGRNGELAFVNAATGNLVLQDRDDLLVGRGPDIAAVRTYNSQGLFDDDNADNWTVGAFGQRVQLSSGSAGAAGSTVTRTDRDGAQAVYAWDGNRNIYVGTAGAGAFDSIAFDAAASIFVWTDGDTGLVERYRSDGRGQLISATDPDGNTVAYAYNANGTVRAVTLASSTDAMGYSTSFSYNAFRESVGSAQTLADGRVVEHRASFDRRGLLVADVTDANGANLRRALAYDAFGRPIERTDGNGGVSRTAYDRRGQVIATTDATGATRSTRYDAFGRTLTQTDALGNETIYSYDAGQRSVTPEQRDHAQRQTIVNGEVLGRYGAMADQRFEGLGLGAPVFANQSEFSFGYQPIDGSYPAGSPGTYAVAQGDTLKSIAKGAYGDAGLWYLIADANGLTSSADLRTGQALTIPTRVASSNNADTFKPYDPSRIVGNTNPAQMPVPGQDGGCGGVGQLIVIAISAVVSYFAGPVVGNVVGQFAGNVLGVQDGFDWKSVALSVVSSGVSQGIGDSVASSVTDATGSAVLGQVANAAVVNAATQGIAVATGLQSRFDWKQVAAAGAGAGVGQALRQPLNTALGGTVAGDFAARFVTGTAAGLTTTALRGGRATAIQVATDAFGNVLAQSLVEASTGVASPSDESWARADPLGELIRRNGNWAGVPATPSFAEDMAARAAALNPYGLPTAPLPFIHVPAQGGVGAAANLNLNLNPNSTPPQPQPSRFDDGATWAEQEFVNRLREVFGPEWRLQEVGTASGRSVAEAAIGTGDPYRPPAGGPGRTIPMPELDIMGNPTGASMNVPVPANVLLPGENVKGNVFFGGAGMDGTYIKDTLKSIAKGAYGDAGLWYLIADANGLTSSADLRTGQVLTIPTRVASSNNADTFKPYDPSRIVGNTNPAQMPVPGQDGGCGGVGQLIVIAISAVVSYFAGPVVGNVVGQFAGNALGVQDGFDWKSVALSVVSSGVSQGIGDSVASSVTDATGSAVLGQVANAAVVNAATQGIAVATGLQSRFDWKQVAAAGAGAGVGQALRQPLNTALGGTVAGDFAARFVTGTAAGLTTTVLRGGRATAIQVATDAFGNVLAQSLVEARTGVASPSDESWARADPLGELIRRNGNWAGVPATPSFAEDMAARRAALNPYGLPTATLPFIRVPDQGGVGAAPNSNPNPNPPQPHRSQYDDGASWAEQEFVNRLRDAYGPGWLQGVQVVVPPIGGTIAGGGYISSKPRGTGAAPGFDPRTDKPRGVPGYGIADPRIGAGAPSFHREPPSWLDFITRGPTPIGLLNNALDNLIFKSPSDILGSNLEAAGYLRPEGSAAHHIVPYGDQRARDLRSQLDALGIDLNSADNGVFLPQVPGSTAPGAYHPSLNNEDYHAQLQRDLGSVGSRDDALDVLDRIRGQLLNGTYPGAQPVPPKP